MGLQFRFVRHEQMADGIVAGLRQVYAELAHFLAEQPVGNLGEHARAVAHQRIGANRAAMREVFEHGKAVNHDLVRLAAFHVCDEADATGIMFVARIVKTCPLRH